ncbi:MAG: trehalose-6-phosphate synthase [Rubrivivax sp.]
MFAIGLCNPQGRLVQQTERYPESLSCARAAEVAREAEPRFELAGGPVHVGLHPVYASPSTAPAAAAEQAIELPAEQASARRPIAKPRRTRTPGSEGRFAAAGATAAEGAEPAVLGQLVLLHDLSFIERRSQDTRRYLIGLIAALGLIIALITVVVAQVSWNGWVRGVRAIMRGEGLLSPLVPAPELAPFAADLRRACATSKTSTAARRAGDRVERGRLRSLLRSHLAGDQVIAVSNREPYIHQRVKDDVESDGAADSDGVRSGRSHIVVQRPASGLVTALEPVMRACSGTWIAHGSGSADRETVDASDRVSVPPGEHAESSYWLRRVWLTPEEEQGYYYGFANEGLWPLCHVAHVRPTFRQGDWAAYREINRRFADAVVAEARDEDPVVLVQDYHFALVPALIRERLPQATVITFWHIPWPNPESFGICPWRSEILQGLLGSTILGFHTRFHCKNFIETVDRYLEARIEHEHSSITYRGEETLIESYPISIAWPEHPDEWPPVAECRARVFARLGLAPETCLALGVDRYDYTKGILERLNAVERLLEKYPQWLERFVFAQVAAPTRSDLDEYRNFQERVERLAERINARFGRPGYKPVHLLAQHHDHAALTELYRAANLCVVTSLHDGMNLVSKEFVAARDDLAGVLVLSRFAGAARELHEALIVNPYHVEETADALHRAATMPAAEQRERMASLRTVVREFNVYRWAGRMLSDAGRWRLRERIAARVQRHRVLARETSAST